MDYLGDASLFSFCQLGLQLDNTVARVSYLPELSLLVGKEHYTIRLCVLLCHHRRAGAWKIIILQTANILSSSRSSPDLILFSFLSLVDVPDPAVNAALLEADQWSDDPCTVPSVGPLMVHSLFLLSSSLHGGVRQG